MKYKYYEALINKNTTGRWDVTPLFKDKVAFSRLIKDLTHPFKNTQFDTIAGLDALGFIVGGAIAHKLKKGFVPVRKGGKLPGVPRTVLRDSFVDYSKKKKTFEMNKGSVRPGERVLIVDEWIETGAQVKSAIRLIERQGGKVCGIIAINADMTKNTAVLFNRYNCRPIHTRVTGTSAQAKKKFIAK